MGNIYLTGNWSSPSLTFDSYSLTNVNSGAENVFLVKYDSMGNVLWARSSQGAGTNYGNSVTTDILGNCYVTGSFSYSPDITFGTYTLTNVNSSTKDVFIVKYDSMGNVLWAQSAGGNGDDNGYCIITEGIFDWNNLFYY